MPTVTFRPSGASARVESGQSVLIAATEAGATTVECCGMQPPCGLCKLAVLDGDANLSPPEPLEAEFRARRRFLPFQRLGCLAQVLGDVEVELER